jgi:colicin import membrane protein
MKLSILAYAADGTPSLSVWPFIISFIGHILLFGVLLFHPGKSSNNAPFQSVINVQMVEMPASAAVTKKAPPKSNEKTSPPEKASAAEKASPETATQPPQQAEVSTAPPQHKVITALKYKTFRSQEVLKNTLQRLEKKVDTSTPKPLEDTIKRIREQVAKEGEPESVKEADAAATAEGKKGSYAHGSKQEGEAIDLYRLDVAYAINKNWAFSEQMAGGAQNLEASVVFKIMPDGKIEDVFFTDRSGNAYLDDSALKAIMKSSPVKPHPPGVNLPYIELGLRFTPKGVK